MFIDIIIGIIYLILFGYVTIAGIYRNPRAIDTPAAYRSVIIQFALTIMTVHFFIATIFLVFYNWKMLLILLAIGLFTSRLVFVPIAEFLLMPLVFYLDKKSLPYKLIDYSLEDHGYYGVKDLLDRGVSVNFQDQEGKTPLTASIYGNQYETALLLIERGANVNVACNQGFTPLMLAADLGRCDFAKLLIENGADINAKDKYNFTPLMFAIESGNLDLVNLLLQNGADINVKTINDLTALSIAESKELQSIIHLLRRYA